MSINLMVVARKGKIEQTFEVFQTPTEDTMKIVRSKNPANEYKSWVKSRWPKDKNFVNDHIRDFEQWLDVVKDFGLRVEFLAI